MKNKPEGYIAVSHGHQLYYELYGNRGGIPILFIHGGPGAGFSDRDKRFFDPEKFLVIFYDQRGASRSKPFGSIENNTTDLLVNDILNLLDHLKIPEVSILGGSWGSTLAMVFAIQYPQKVKAMILRGVFLGNKQSIKHYLGGGVRLVFPEAWEKFQSLVPPDKLSNIGAYYLKMMLSKSTVISEQYAKAWASYELSIFKRHIEEDDLPAIIESFPYKSLAILEAWYLSNECFLPEDYILKNINQFQNIPVSIIHGRYDMICPPLYAYQIHKKLPNSKLQFVDAGHADSEPEIEAAIKEALEKLR